MTADPRAEFRALLAQVGPALARFLRPSRTQYDPEVWQQLLAPITFGPSEKAPLPRADDYDSIRADLEDALFEAFIGYASSGGRVTSYRNAAGRAVIEAHSAAFYRGVADAGAEEVDPEDDAWLTARQNEQRGYLAGVFDWLKEQRDAETVTEDAVRARVEQWAQALDATYSEALMRGKKNQMLEWHYGDTDHCETCQRLNGQRHRARWYLDRDYIPGKPGASMLCGGYRCQCYLTDPEGNTVTL